MALTSNNLQLIKAVANNDIHTAKLAALASMAEDSSKKNESVIRQYKKLFEGNISSIVLNLPTALKTILVGEAPGGFDPERYYIRDTEEKVVSDIVKMKAVADRMSEKKIPYKNTLLLYGESGTGKTELGRYIAYRLNLPFFYISFVSTIDSYMGSTAKNLHKVFEFCSSIPCVLMLDEFDCVAAKRSSGGGKGCDGELERTTISIMQELDRLPNHVTLIAATNRMDMVDEAMLRRFSVRHEVQNMSKKDLVELAEKFVTSTDTGEYIGEEQICRLAENCRNPGQMMPELIRIIGLSMYNDIPEEDLLEESAHGSDSHIWEVLYEWKSTVCAETEEDAIAIGRKNRTSYQNCGALETYKAKRV